MLGNLFNQKKDPQPVVVQGTSQTAVSIDTNLPIQLDTNGIPISSSVQLTQSSPVPPQPVTVDASQPVVGSSIDAVKRQDMSALSHLDSRALQALTHAQEEASRTKQQFIEPELLLYGLLFDQEIFALLEQFHVDAAKVTKEIQEKEQMGSATTEPTLSDGSKQIFEAAYLEAKKRNVAFVSAEDLLVALFSSSSSSALLTAEGLQRDAVIEKLTKNPHFQTGKASVLDQFGVDLTQEARDGKLDPITGRDKEIERIVHILLRRTKNNPIIIGEAGVGKTAIVEGLAQQIVTGVIPQDLANKRIIQLDVSSLVAGASHRGEFEERLRSVINEAMMSSGQIVLFIDEIHTLMGTGDSDGALDASNIIKPHLARGHLQIIGTTTTAEYRKYFEKDKAFERRFQPILCEEPSEETAIAMLAILKAKYEKFHSVVMPDDALAAAVHLSKKYIGERFLPDKAVDLLDEAAADVKLQHAAGKRQDNTVNKADIEKVVSIWTGIPITKLTEDESQKLLHIDDLIHKRLIGQEEAVEAVAEAVRRGRIGLAPANRPIASFIFLGPTGVGKTELAKTLAEILFGKDDLMVRLDMSEYMEKHEVAKLIGAPPGYVGYEEGGQLTEAVRAKPYSIVLLDEIEKAHPDVFNILLQLLEDGRLTDNKGNTISFKNTIVIATSNIGSALIQQELGKETKSKEEFEKNFAELHGLINEELHKFFKPELLNRFDEVVIFKPLMLKDMSMIAKNNIGLTARLLQEQGFDLQITQRALEQLGKEGYDPVYGARPLRRLIQTVIENPIALLLINKTFVTPDIILVDYDAEKAQYTFAKSTPATPSNPAANSTTPVSDATPPTQTPQAPAGISTLPQPQSQVPDAQTTNQPPSPMQTVQAPVVDPQQPQPMIQPSGQSTNSLTPTLSLSPQPVDSSFQQPQVSSDGTAMQKAPTS
jgi:ATP-dependent Clp protease ATP-binding subunit ClpC